MREDQATPGLKSRNLGDPYPIPPETHNRNFKEGQSALRTYRTRPFTFNAAHPKTLSETPSEVFRAGDSLFGKESGRRDYSRAILPPGSTFFERCSMRSSMISLIALRNSIREFARCCRTSGETPRRERT